MDEIRDRVMSTNTLTSCVGDTMQLFVRMKENELILSTPYGQQQYNMAQSQQTQEGT